MSGEGFLPDERFLPLLFRIFDDLGISDKTSEDFGLAAWRIFSNNNDVTSPDGQIVETGSWRATADAIATFLHGSRGDYLGYYCASPPNGDAFVEPILRWLSEHGYTYTYIIDTWT